jgi:precorrin-6B methylase 2
MRAPLTVKLRAQPPLLHGEAEFWGLEWNALSWLEETVQAGMATLETGAGASTIVFAASGAAHQVVTADAEEETRIRAECERLGISSDEVSFAIGLSHEVLPKLEPRALDLALIDGAHGFPYPVLDWWYVAPQLKVGGLVVLDDSYMAPVGLLLDWLDSSPAWRVEKAPGFRTVVVRKLAEELPPFDWHGERVGRKLSFRYLPPLRRGRAAVRQRIFTTRLGLAAVRFARRRAGFLWRQR